jgi:ribosomal protein S26
MHDPVNQPSHYTSNKASCKICDEKIECIDITKHMNFCLGNAIKYIWRAGLKNDTIEDLQKAIVYIQYEIEKIEQAQASHNP